MLNCKNLCKSFSNSYSQTTVLRNLNLTLAPGSFNVLIGGNGAGKSTLMQLIAGALQPDSGNIQLGELDLLQLNTPERFRHLALVHQDPARGSVGSLTVLENLALAKAKLDAAPLRAVIAFNKRLKAEQRRYYTAYLSELGMGLEQHLDTPVSCLSGGQRQALTLAMCLLSPVKLLLLDEHTAALDPKASEQLMQLTETFVRQHQVTALMVTHDLEQALTYGDRLLMMQQGQITLDLTGAEKKALQTKDLLEVYYQPPLISASALHL